MTERVLLPLSPRADARVSRDSVLAVRWTPTRDATDDTVEFEDDNGQSLLSAVVREGSTSDLVPPTPFEQLGASARIRWRMNAVAARGNVLRHSSWRGLSVRH